MCMLIIDMIIIFNFNLLLNLTINKDSLILRLRILRTFAPITAAKAVIDQQV